MITLTYARADGWQPHHVKDCLRHLRQYMRRTYQWRLRYIWVMEVKNRLSGVDVGKAAPHYHLVCWLPSSLEESDLHFDTRGWWPYGLTNVVRAVAPVRYVMKYVSKFDEAAAFPSNARCYGVGGLEREGRECRRWINWPSFVQARASVSCRWQRRVGGGWVDLDTGEFLCSEWRLASVTRKQTRLLRVATHPRPLQPMGPFSWMRS